MPNQFLSEPLETNFSNPQYSHSIFPQFQTQSNIHTLIFDKAHSNRSRPHNLHTSDHFKYSKKNII